jgi:hypothetical protein
MPQAWNRFGGHAAQWIEEIARRRTDFEVELIDLKDYAAPRHSVHHLISKFLSRLR